MNEDILGGRPLETIYIGGVCASHSPFVVRTVLGSCIAVCLRDPVTKVGGMNHFMLPHGSKDSEASARYGIHAMELLINECMKQGADRRRLEAKVFGGGHVLKTVETSQSVPKLNMEFALRFLQTESIGIVSKDIGGFAAREILFFTDSGRTLLKRLRDVRLDEDMPTPVRLKPATDSTDDNVTLF